MLKCFGAHNIEMEAGRIVAIEGLTVDSDTGESSIDPNIIKVKNVRSYQGLGIEKGEEKPQVDFLDGWSKYLSSLENKRTKNTQTFSTSYSTRLDESTESYF